MESLHLSYREVFEELPYRTLLLMCKDKQRSTSNEVWEEMTDEEEEAFFSGKMKGQK